MFFQVIVCSTGDSPVELSILRWWENESFPNGVLYECLQIPNINSGVKELGLDSTVNGLVVSNQYPCCPLEYGLSISFSEAMGRYLSTSSITRGFFKFRYQKGKSGLSISFKGSFFWTNVL